MDMQDIVDLSRRLSYRTQAQVPDDVLVEYSNINYKQLVRKIITEINENFFYDERTTDLVENQTEYHMPSALSTSQWALKMLSVECKYKATDKYIKLTSNTLWSLPKAIEYYKTEQPATNPFYRIAENSLFIYPTPTIDVVEWLRLFWIKNAINLAIDAEEWDFIIPKEYLHLIAYGNIYHIYLADWEIQKAQNMKQNYYDEMQQMIKELSDRNLSVEEIILPNLRWLE